MLSESLEYRLVPECKSLINWIGLAYLSGLLGRESPHSFSLLSWSASLDDSLDNS